ncbi:MAG: ABC transporter ATP-binding protein [Anaerolineae bacterium]|nr:ABC transporter ATP-binding protein [Anaerolineae bacterium]
MIETHNLTRHFGALVAVHDLNLQIARGEVFGFLGPNGAGKTTTVRLLNGVLNPTAGEIRVLGMDPIAQGPAVRRRTGVLTESPALYEPLSARDNLLIFGELYDVPANVLRRRVDELLEMFELTARADDKVAGYSKGMKQRLALARALIHAPEILFLDEPTAGLDPEAARQVTELIEHLSQEEGRTIFLCTHNLVEAERLCDRVGVVNRGELIAVGTPEELARRIWHGHGIVVRLGRPLSAETLASLKRLEGVAQVEVENSDLHVLLDQEHRTPAVVRALVEAGAEIYAVRPREHSLEDIYFQLQANARGGSA